MVFNELCGEAGDDYEKNIADVLPNFRYLYETQSAYGRGDSGFPCSSIFVVTPRLSWELGSKTPCQYVQSDNN